MFTPRALVNAISLSRIGLALLFVLCFQPAAGWLYVSVGVCAVALATDIGDGLLARWFGIASIKGRHWDSLGDKAFYVAVIVAYLNHGLLGPTLGWALLVREIALYITRILYIENLPAVEQIRPFTNWHGYFMYAVIVLGLVSMLGQVHGHPLNVYVYVQAAALGALACGLISIFAFIRLPKEE